MKGEIQVIYKTLLKKSGKEIKLPSFYVFCINKFIELFLAVIGVEIEKLKTSFQCLGKSTA